jgi:hypothetical protein
VAGEIRYAPEMNARMEEPRLTGAEDYLQLVPGLLKTEDFKQPILYRIEAPGKIHKVFPIIISPG